MRIPKMPLMALAFSVLAGSAQNLPDPCDQIVYKDRNQISPPVMELGLAEGVVQDEYGGVRIPMVCVAVFTEPGHKRVAVGKTDERGRFRLSGVPPGTYRLVAQYVEGFCPANRLVRILEKPGRSAVVHMKASGIDSCSWIDDK